MGCGEAESPLALVSGGGGFLGRYLVEQLARRGNRVRCFARGSYRELEVAGVEVQRGDIRDFRAVAEAVEGVECVYHAAALAGGGGRWIDYYETNVRGTENVIAACRRHGTARLVYTSSPSVVFAGRDQCGIDESAPYDMKWLQQHGCHYSRSKALAEQAVLRANGPDLRTCALRPHLIWGPRDNHLIPRLLDRARRGRLRRVGDGSNRVDVTYVENAAAAHLDAADALASADAAPAGNAYFISQSSPVNCWEWIDEVLALAGLPPVRRAISARAAWRLGAWCEQAYRLLRPRSEPPMTRFVAAQLATSHWYDVSRAQADFGYRPQVSMAEGMRRLQAWLAACGLANSASGNR